MNAGSVSHDRFSTTVHIANIDISRVSWRLIYELCIQFGRVRNISWPHDKGVGTVGEARPADYCFVEFMSVEEAQYCYLILSNSSVKLFRNELKATIRTAATLGQRPVGLFEVGAKLFVYNLVPNVSTTELTQLFEQFGALAAPPRLLVDSDGNSRGCCLASFQDFETSDCVLKELNGKVFKDRILGIEYADLEDGSGRKHGNAEERANAETFKRSAAEHKAVIASARLAQPYAMEQNTAWAEAAQRQLNFR